MKKGSHHSEKTKKEIGKNCKGKQLREKHYNWKGGFAYDRGYILYKLPKNHEFSCMSTKHGYVRFHRLIMAMYLQRPLRNNEIVYHILDNKEGIKGKKKKYYIKNRKDILKNQKQYRKNKKN